MDRRTPAHRRPRRPPRRPTAALPPAPGLAQEPPAPFGFDAVVARARAAAGERLRPAADGDGAALRRPAGTTSSAASASATTAACSPTAAAASRWSCCRRASPSRTGSRSTSSPATGGCSRSPSRPTTSPSTPTTSPSPTAAPRPASPSDMGFSGIRFRYPINRPGVWDEVAVFQGASYFRAVAHDTLYGLSARGLAIGTGGPEPEEFPIFTAFWVHEPQPGEPHAAAAGAARQRVRRRRLRLPRSSPASRPRCGSRPCSSRAARSPRSASRR